MALLWTQNLTKRFEGITAVNDVTFSLEAKEVRGLIGPNGSGKTTFLNLINGVYPPDGGFIYFKEERINNLRPYEITVKGIGRTFQITRIFRRMTVLENMLVPALTTHSFSNDEERFKKSFDLLKFVGLDHLTYEKGGNLSGGQQKLLEFARVLMMNPDIVLLDEPFSGVNPAIKEELMKTVKEMNSRDITFILVTHDIPSVLELCGRITVFDAGKMIAEGTSDEIISDERVIEAYLGV